MLSWSILCSRSNTVGQSPFGSNVCQKGLSCIVQSAGRGFEQVEKVMDVIQARSNQRRTAHASWFRDYVTK